MLSVCQSVDLANFTSRSSLALPSFPNVIIIAVYERICIGAEPLPSRSKKNRKKKETSELRRGGDEKETKLSEKRGNVRTALLNNPYTDSRMLAITLVLVSSHTRRVQRSCTQLHDTVTTRCSPRYRVGRTKTSGVGARNLVAAQPRDARA